MLLVAMRVLSRIPINTMTGPKSHLSIYLSRVNWSGLTEPEILEVLENGEGDSGSNLSILVHPHKRIRKLHKGAHDFARTEHSQSEHLSHGKGSYRKLHAYDQEPRGIRAAEKGR